MITLVGSTHPYKGGVAQHTTSLAEHLADRGLTVDLLSWKAQYPKRLYPGELELADPGSERKFPGTRRELAWYSPWSWWRSAEPVRRSDLLVLSLVNGVQVPAYRCIQIRARRAGVRTVVLCHNVFPHESDPVQRLLIRGLLCAADGVVVHSRSEKEAAESLGACKVEHVRMPFHFPSKPGIPTPPDGSGRVLFFGFVRPYKGVDVLIEALARTERHICATVAGEFWTPASELRSQAARLGVVDRVELVDRYLPAAELLELLRSHDAVVMPDRSGTGSQQPQIARLGGRVVIASRIGDLPDQVRDGVDGLLVDPGDSIGLARSLDSLYDGGRLQLLSGNVEPPDEDADWDNYVEALTRC